MFKLSSLILMLFVFVNSTQLFAEEESYSQKSTQKGVYELGGTFSVVSTANGTQISIRPELGYFFWDRTQLGFNGSVSVSSFKTTGSVGLTANHYFNVEKNYATFVIQSASSSYGEEINSQFGSTGLGVAVFFNPNVAYKTIASLSYPLKGEVVFSSVISGSLAFYF